MPSSIAPSVDEMVTSLTGNARSPFSIQKPAAAREKSNPIAAPGEGPCRSAADAGRCARDDDDS